MAELKITFDIRLTPRLAKYGLAAALVCLCVPELASESVTLSTYYPAPSGVYTTLITTGNTYLARDGGSVGIGTTSPAYKLDVAGTGNFSSTLNVGSNLTVGGAASVGSSLSVGAQITANAYMPNYTGWATYGVGAGGAAIYNDAGAYRTLMLVGNNSGGGSRQVGVWDQLTVNGSETVSGAVDVYTSSVFRGYGGANCSGTPATYGAGVTNCPGGTYATLISGIMTKYQIIADPVNPTGEMLCCNCGSMGCPAF